ncbi:MAG TPA: hypothetical protein PLP34_07530, partial [Chitinophagaceae bacterium]|nr:hypothetical protein [Chitinophagaceae bacterium]
FDCMPESVLMIPEPMEPIQPRHQKYDLVLFGYQPWFLSPSIPAGSFLQSTQASILKNHNVVTVIGSRNMWLNAQEQVKRLILRNGGLLRGNLVFFDRNPNLISLLTVIRWSFKGKKEAGRFLPDAGVQEKDIQEAKRFGTLLTEALVTEVWDRLQERLVQAGGVELNPALVVLERRGITNFRKFAPWILAKGKRGDMERRVRVNVFRRLLLTGVFILSPISSFTAKLNVLFKRREIEEEVNYYKSIQYREKAI